MTGIRWADDRWPARRWTLLPGLVVLGALFLPPSTVGTAGPTVKDEAFITAETSGLLHIEAGECFTDPVHLSEVTEATVLYTRCDEQAANQSYGFVHAPDGEWDPVGLGTFARESCQRGFDSHWSGESAAKLAFYPVLSTEKTWADGDRDVMCVVYSPEGPMNGSALPWRDDEADGRGSSRARGKSRLSSGNSKSQADDLGFLWWTIQGLNL